MDKETREKLAARLHEVELRLHPLPSEQAAAFQFRVCATHLLEAADRLDMGDIAYGFIVAESMSFELNHKAFALKSLAMSLPLEGRSLIDVLNDAESTAHHRFLELLETACAANDDKRENWAGDDK